LKRLESIIFALSLGTALLAAGCAAATNGPRPATWADLSGRQLVVVSGQPVALVPPSSVAVSFGEFASGLLVPSVNQIGVAGGCRSFATMETRAADAPRLDADGVLEYDGSYSTRTDVCLDGSDARVGWVLRLLQSSPRISIDGRNAIFTSSGAAVTMTDGTVQPSGAGNSP